MSSEDKSNGNERSYHNGSNNNKNNGDEMNDPLPSNHQFIRRRYDDHTDTRASDMQNNQQQLRSVPPSKTTDPQVGAHPMLGRPRGERPVWSHQPPATPAAAVTTPPASADPLVVAELVPDIPTVQASPLIEQNAPLATPSAAATTTSPPSASSTGEERSNRRRGRINFLQRLGNFGGSRRRLLGRRTDDAAQYISQSASNLAAPTASAPSSRKPQQTHSNETAATTLGSTSSTRNLSARSASVRSLTSAPSRRSLLEDDDEEQDQAYSRIMAGIRTAPAASPPPPPPQPAIPEPAPARASSSSTRNSASGPSVGMQVESVLEIFPEANMTRIMELLRQESLTTALVVLAEESSNNLPSDEVVGPSQLQYATTYAQATTADRKIIMGYLREMFPTFDESEIESVLMKNSTHKGVAILSERISRRQNQNVLQQQQQQQNGNSARQPGSRSNNNNSNNNNNRGSRSRRQNETSGRAARVARETGEPERQLTLLMDDEPVVRHRGKLKPPPPQEPADATDDILASLEALGPPVFKQQRSNSFSNFGQNDEGDSKLPPQGEHSEDIKPPSRRSSSIGNMPDLNHSASFDRILQRLNESHLTAQDSGHFSQRTADNRFYDISALQDP